MKQLAIFLTAFLTLLASPLAAEPDFPELTGRVVYAADIIPAEVETELTAKLEALEEQSEAQMVIATVPSLQGNDIATFGYQLGRVWEIGDAERNDGVVLLVAPNEREVRIEVGYGLEGVLTDAVSSIIVQNDILPEFRNGDMPAGISAGTDAIVALLVLPEDEARAQALQLTAAESERGGTPIWLLPAILLTPILFIALVGVFGSAKTGTTYRGSGSGIRTYSSSSSSSWSSSSSSSSSFSGGGGSFGGGGSSGSW
ncbi:MAG: TPM domain-containing protein [Pseudomonadota bacterium]